MVSYNDIALNANLRKATVSNSFNGNTAPNMVTLINIIEGMGFNLLEFAKIYHSISYFDIVKFKRLKS